MKVSPVSQGENMKRLFTALFTAMLLATITGCSTTNNPPASVESSESQLPDVDENFPEPVEVLDYHFAYESDTNFSQFVAVVKNPNEALTLESVLLTVVAVDSQGVVLETAEANIYRLAPLETGLVEIRTITGRAASAEISLSEPNYTSKTDLSASFTESNFSQVKTKIDKYIVNTSAVLSVPEDGLSDSVLVCAAFYDSKRDLVGGMCRSTDVIRGRKNAVEVYTLAPRVKPSTIELFAQYEG